MTKANPSARLSRLALAGIAAVALAAPIGAAHADKVGVAAAVNPDAFSSLSGSPQTQLNIGKSIFFSERINTTGSGLVQVLLVDGSTFTVGPGSDLVIDKFVYDPNKKSGEIVASFSKGVMRFVGGKISKNPDGVTVNTPAGALAIRGGMVQGSVTGNKAIFSFLFGETMTLTGKNGQQYTVFQPGNTIDTTGGVANIRATTAGDIALIMAALTPGGNGGVTPGTTPQPAGNGVKAATLGNIAGEIINEATATQIQDQIQKEIDSLNNTPTETPTTPGELTTPPPTTGDTTPPPTTGDTTPPANTPALGYAAGAFTQTSDSESNYLDRAGTMISYSPTDVALSFDGTTKAFSGPDAGAVFKLFSSDDGGAQITFAPISLPDNVPQNVKDQLGASGFFFGAALANPDNQNDSIISYEHTGEDFPPTFVTTSRQLVNQGEAVLIGVRGNGSVFCTDCNFMTWGAWLTDLNVQNSNQNSNPSGDHALTYLPPTSSQITAVGWWVAADSLPTIGQLPTLGTASYDGHTIGQVVYYGNDFLAKGDVHMDWDFQQRAGVLDITNFGVPENNNVPVLNASGRMDTPGIATNLTNRFSGPLLGTLGSPQQCETIGVSGIANGSFAANGNDKTAGVIGNFSVATSGNNPSYQASGVFGAGRVGAVNPTGNPDISDRIRLFGRN